MATSEFKSSAARKQEGQHGDGRKKHSRLASPSACREVVLTEDSFHAMLARERRRAERSRKPVVLILVDSHALRRNGHGTAFLEQVIAAVSNASRETDLIGWYEDDLILGVIFTEINSKGMTPVVEVLHSKVLAALRDNLDHNLTSTLSVTVHVFPESWDAHRPDRMADIRVSQEHVQRTSQNRLPIIIKRGIDILGSCLLLLVFSPLLAAVALAIKLGSKGPVIFEQERIGWLGMRFKCLKFRTMYTNNDSRIHRDYVHSLIKGKTAKGNDGKNAPEPNPAVYKITSDPRVTPIGRFLRKTSLDEFPQFWNVLRGEMSLVGPRPPVPYEFEFYDDWHRRRVFEMKPGVTGLWQVAGRSRVGFDDMVRLDLRYSQRWSLSLDLKILLATPLAALKGEGAY